jgi:hypothetical protein
MKRFLLVLVLIIMVGCGIINGNYNADLTIDHNSFYAASGGSQATWTDSAVINVISNTTNLTINNGGWFVTKNAGGAGSITIASTTVSGDCAAAAALETIAFTAGVVSTTETALKPATITAFNAFADASAGTGYKLCITYEQTDTLSPINVELRMRLNITSKLKNN